MSTLTRFPVHHDRIRLSIMTRIGVHHERDYAILSRENMAAARTRVKANKGSAGMEELSMEQTEGYLKTLWPKIRGEVSAASRAPRVDSETRGRGAGIGNPNGGGPADLDNVLLDEVDKELGRRRLRFARSPNDFNVFTPG